MNPFAFMKSCNPIWKEGIRPPTGKACRKCGFWKPLDGYHKNQNFRDGRWNVCKECRRG